ncbi:uncharacterized protein Hap1MRO34_006899 isoform 1-T2 [Clarias gariepinus]
MEQSGNGQKKEMPKAESDHEGHSVFISATDASNVIAPVMIDNQISDFKMNLNNGAQKMTDEKQPVSKNNETFLKRNRGKLIDKVKNVNRIADELLTDEKLANVQAEQTDQAKMRKLLDYTNTKSAAQLLVDALYKHEPDVMKELTTA